MGVELRRIKNTLLMLSIMIVDVDKELENIDSTILGRDCHTQLLCLFVTIMFFKQLQVTYQMCLMQFTIAVPSGVISV